MVAVREPSLDLLHTLPEIATVAISNAAEGTKAESGETLQGLETDIRRLTHIAYQSVQAEPLDQITTQSFICGVRENVVRNALLLTKYSNTKEVF